MQVIIDEGGEQVMCGGDGVQIAVEVQVDALHGQQLGFARAGRAAFHAEDGAERGFAQGDHGIRADRAESLAEGDRGERLAFAGFGGRDGGDEDELAVGLVLAVADRSKFQFAGELAVELELVLGEVHLSHEMAHVSHVGLRGGHRGALLQVPTVSPGMGPKATEHLTQPRARCTPVRPVASRHQVVNRG